MVSAHGMDLSENRPNRKVRLWLWFAAGFLLLFVYMSVTITMTSMRPSGDALVVCKLWRYYVIEIRRALSSGGAVGPASGSSSSAAMLALQHLLCSGAGGFVAMGSAWTYYKVKGR
jgi:hypothetical protein